MILDHGTQWRHLGCVWSGGGFIARKGKRTMSDTTSVKILREALEACATGKTWGSPACPATPTGSERMRAALALTVLDRDVQAGGELKKTTLVKVETLINPPPGAS